MWGFRFRFRFRSWDCHTGKQGWFSQSVTWYYWLWSNRKMEVRGEAIIGKSSPKAVEEEFTDVSPCMSWSPGPTTCHHMQGPPSTKRGNMDKAKAFGAPYHSASLFPSCCFWKAIFLLEKKSFYSGLKQKRIHSIFLNRDIWQRTFSSGSEERWSKTEVHKRAVHRTGSSCLGFTTRSCVALGNLLPISEPLFSSTIRWRFWTRGTLGLSLPGNALVFRGRKN